MDDALAELEEGYYVVWGNNCVYEDVEGYLYSINNDEYIDSTPIRAEPYCRH